MLQSIQFDISNFSLFLKAAHLFMAFLNSKGGHSYCQWGSNSEQLKMAASLVMMRKVPLLLYICLIYQLLTPCYSDNVDEFLKPECAYDVQKLWMREVANSPFAAAPLIADVNGDGRLDVVAAPFSESFTVLDGTTGQHLPDTLWPVQSLHSSMYASPLQYDADGDGMFDLLFCTSSGELIFYSANGTRMKKYKKLPPTFVQDKWYQKVVISSAETINQFVKMEWPSRETDSSKYLQVSPHILATPVIADLNRDGVIEEIVIPVSYYYDEDEYRLAQQLHKSQKNTTVADLEKYLIGGVVYLNLTSMDVMHTVFLELSQMTASFPAYILFTPTVIDLDSNGGDLETITGTSSGKIYAINNGGQIRSGFPLSLNTVHGQLTVADVNHDGQLEIIAVDTSGNVACFDRTGRTLWESEISGSSSSGTRLADINQDEKYELLITTDNGDFYVLHGINGSIFKGYPQKLNSDIYANVLLSLLHDEDVPLFFALPSDGHLNIISTNLECHTKVNIAESSLVQILSHDLVPQTKNMELLVATKDGTIICFSVSQPYIEKEEDYSTEIAMLASLPSEMKSANDFVFLFHKPRVEIMKHTKDAIDIMGSYFRLDFKITDPDAGDKGRPYDIRVYYGSHLLVQSSYEEPGQYSLSVPVWLEPSQGHIVVVLTNQHGQIFQDNYSIKFNKLILQDLQWLLISPFVAMAVILLVIHGFPAKDLLPLTNKDKNR